MERQTMKSILGVRKHGHCNVLAACTLPSGDTALGNVMISVQPLKSVVINCYVFKNTSHMLCGPKIPNNPSLWKQ